MPAVDSLIEQARRGDRMALERLLIAHAEPLRVHLLRGLPSRVKGLISVEDVVQETLAKAFLKIDRFRGESRHAFAAWLLVIGDMTLVDLVRRETRQARGGQFNRQEFAGDSVKGSLVDLLAQLPGEEKTGSQIVADAEGVAALQVAIAGLPHDQQQAIQLRLLQGNTLQETSAAMDRTPAAIRSLIHRAKENLAEAMGRASLWLTRN